MGCINSTNKHIYAFKRDGVFNASVVRVHAEQSLILPRQGCFEITPQELIFISSDNEPIAWALQHLRRYGLTGNIFSFEAGRRCATGPGVYTFRCSNADQFYAKFQRCINSMPLFCERRNSLIHPSRLFGRLDLHQQNSNHYLEPSSAQLPSLTDGHAFLAESTSNISNNFILNSPNSTQSASLTAEIVNFTSNVHPYSNISLNQNLFFSGANLYMEQPMSNSQERNNNISAQEECESLNCIAKNFEAGPILKSSSLNTPPEEFASIIPSCSLEIRCDCNAYFNSLVGTSTTQSICINSADRAYANVDVSSQLEKAITPSVQRESLQLELVHEQLPQNTFSTPVNYIILDLDQPRSPPQCFPKNDVGIRHLLSVSSENIEIKNQDISSITAANSRGSSTMPKGCTIHNDNGELSNMDSAGSYTKIDFLKTFALMKSSTNYTDFELDNDQEESRITRHSKFVRKAYSISE